MNSCQVILEIQDTPLGFFKGTDLLILIPHLRK